MPDAKARILYNADTWDAATITSSSQATDFDDDNAVHDFVSQPWRTTGKASEWIKFDLGTATALTCVGIFAHTLTASATVTLQANATDSWGSPTYSQALTMASDSDSVVLEQIVFCLSQEFRWWRITFADAGNANAYIQVGRIIAGAYYEFDRNYNSNINRVLMDPSEGDQTPGRQDHRRSRKRYRQFVLGVQLQNETQSEKLEAIYRKIGNEKPCVLMADYTNKPTAWSMYGYLKTPLSLAHRFNRYFDTANLVFSEVNE